MPHGLPDVPGSYSCLVLKWFKCCYAIRHTIFLVADTDELHCW